MNLLHTLRYLVTDYPILVYGVIIFIGYVEGPVLALICGILYRLGYLDLIPVYFALMLGDLIGDCFWYWLGYHFGHRFVVRFGKYFSIDEIKIRTVEKIFQKHKNVILIVSKLTSGFGFALVTLFTAGMSKIQFKTYITLNTVGQFVWTAFLLVMGYTFGNLFITFNNVFARISLTSFFIIIIALVFGFGKFVRERVLEKNA